MNCKDVKLKLKNEVWIYIYIGSIVAVDNTVTLKINLKFKVTFFKILTNLRMYCSYCVLRNLPGSLITCLHEREQSLAKRNH